MEFLLGGDLLTEYRRIQKKSSLGLLVPRKPDLYTTGSVLRIVKYTSSVTSYCRDDVAVSVSTS